MSVLASFRRKAFATAGVNASPGPIGLDIDSGAIHLCQIRPLEKGMYSILAKRSIEYAGSREALLSAPRELKQLIRGALGQGNFKGRKVVALMPWNEVRILLLTYKSNVVDVDAEVVKMLEKRIEGSIDDYIVDYIPVRSKASDEEHLVVATIAGKDRVEFFLNCLIKCGLDVEALDVAPTALRRLVSTLYTGEAAANVLLINTYPDESYLTIVSGRRLLFNQTVPFGENMLLESIAGALDISSKKARQLVSHNGIENQFRAVAGDPHGFGEDISATLRQIVKPCFLQLIEEINRVLIFTASETRGIPVSRVCLFGSIAQWPGSLQLLLSLLELDIPDGQIEFNHIFQDENDETRLPWAGLFSDLSIVMGLALRGLVE